MNTNKHLYRFFLPALHDHDNSDELIPTRIECQPSTSEIITSIDLHPAKDYGRLLQGIAHSFSFCFVVNDFACLLHQRATFNAPAFHNDKVGRHPTQPQIFHLSLIHIEFNSPCTLSSSSVHRFEEDEEYGRGLRLS
jgi:hypothetical protein